MRAILTETVRLAHQADFPPFAFVRDGKSVGLFIDLIVAAAAREKMPVAFVPVPFAGVQHTLTDGRAQAIFPFGNIPDRRQTFDFSDELVATGGALFVRTSAPLPQHLAALAGQSLATPRTGPLASFIAKNAPDVRLILSSDYEDSLAQVVCGDVDAAALNAQVGAQLAAMLYPGQLKRAPGLFAEQPLAIGVSKGQNATVLTRLNAGLAAIRADGTWRRINDFWTTM